MKSFKFWINTVVISVIAAALSFAGWWVSQNTKFIAGVFTGTKFYTADYVQEQYDKGYSDGNAQESQYEARITELLNSIDELTQAKESLINSVQHGETNISNLQTQITGLIEQLNNKIAEIEELHETAGSLNDIIFNLQSQVLNLQEMLDYYINGSIPVNKYAVNFLTSGGLAHLSFLVESGNIIKDIPSLPHTVSHYFAGWSLDGSNIINLENYLVTNDVNFYPVFNIRFINFDINQVLYNTNDSYESDNFEFYNYLSNFSEVDLNGVASYVEYVEISFKFSYGSYAEYKTLKVLQVDDEDLCSVFHSFNTNSVDYSSFIFLALGTERLSCLYSLYNMDTWKDSNGPYKLEILTCTVGFNYPGITVVV